VLLAHPQVGRQPPIRIHRWRPSVRIGTASRRVAHYHTAIIAVLSTAWVITVIGGYSLGWNWIGYLGHSLRDWLQLLLVPLVFPTILIPAMLKSVSGDVAGRVEATRTAAIAHPHRKPPASAPARH
jgi:hypothetical protein